MLLHSNGPSPQVYTHPYLKGRSNSTASSPLASCDSQHTSKTCQCSTHPRHVNADVSRSNLNASVLTCDTGGQMQSMPQMQPVYPYAHAQQAQPVHHQYVTHQY